MTTDLNKRQEAELKQTESRVMDRFKRNDVGVKPEDKRVMFPTRTADDVKKNEVRNG